LQQVLQNNSKLKVSFDKTTLRNDIQATLGQNPFKINIVVDKASATQAVQMALQQSSVWNGKYTVDDLRAEKARTEQAIQNWRNAQAAAAKAKSAHHAAARAADEHSGASIRLRSALGSNISVAGQLKDQFVSLYSVYAAEQFLSKVVDIGGELEHQKLALDAILKDKGKTQDLFGEIRSLALKSPFGVMDLNQYAKQLSAFTVPYNELYDTMKRLADISAGTGVDMQRLILAYGKTKNRTFLDGLEAKQFAYANIPIYDKLSKKLTELEGKFVSVADVMKRISKKQISFDMVKDVLWDLTDEGGMFNNMQEVLSGSVKTRWKLVKDALDLMYGDLAESLSTPLKGVADVLISLTKNWGKVAAAMTVAAGTYGVVKAASYLLTKGMMTEAAATNAEIVSTKRSEAAKIRLAATYRQLTAVEQYQLTNSRKQIVYDIQAAVTSGALTKEKALQLIAMRKLSTQQAKYLVDIKMITDAERLQAASANRWRIAWVQFGNAMRNVWASIAKALPSLGVFAAITLIVEGIMKYTEKAREAKEETEKLQQKANETFKNLGENLKTNTLEGLPSMTREQISAAIDEMVQTIKDYHPAAGNILESVFGDGSQAKSIQEQYKELRQAILDLYQAQQIVANNASLVQDANDATDGWFDDSLTENINDYSAAVNRMRKAQDDAVASGINLQNSLQNIGKHFPELAQQMQGKSLVEQLQTLQKYYKSASASIRIDLYQYIKMNERIREYINEAINAGYDFDKLLPDIDTWVNYTKQVLSQQGYDFSKTLTGAQENAVRTMVKSLVDSAKDAAPEVRSEIEKELLKKFNISVAIDFEGSEKAIEQWKEHLKTSLQGKFDTTINAAADYTSVVDAVRKSYKTAKEEANKLEPVLLKAGIKFTAGKKIEGVTMYADQRQRELIEQYNNYVDTINAAIEGSQTEGFSLETEKQQRAAAKQAESALTKRLKERLSLLKSAYSEYQRWSELIGKDEAIKKLKESNVYSALFSDKNFNIEELRANIVKLVKEAKAALKDISAQSFARQGEEELLKFDYDATKTDLDKAKQVIEKFVSDTTDQWKLYDDILTKTGNEEYAKLAFSNTGVWDEAASAMRTRLEQEMAKAKFSPDTIIDWNMDEGAAKIFFNNNEALLKLYQEIQKQIKANARTILTEGAAAMASQYDKEEQIKRLEEQISKLRKKLAENPDLADGINAQIEQLTENINQLKSELFSLSPLYEQIFGSMEYQDWGAVNKAAKLAKTLVKNSNPIKNGKAKPSAYSTFYMDNGEKKEIILTEAQLKKLRESIDGFFETKVNKNPFRTLIESIKKLRQAYKDNDKTIDKGKAWGELGKSISKSADQVADLANSFQEMFEALGNEGAAKAMETISFVASGVSSISQGFATGGVFGGVTASISVGLSGLTKIFNAHDAAIERYIELSNQRVSQLENLSDAIDRLLERSLTTSANTEPDSLKDDIAKYNAYKSIIEQVNAVLAKGQKISYGDYIWYATALAVVDKYKNRMDAYEKGGVYAYQRELLQEELAEKESQLAKLEDAKGDKSEEIISTQKEIAELKDEILDYAEETADTLYGINLKDWSSRIGDALYSAWQQGEDGAKAFRDTVGDIMGDVMNNILKVSVLQPAMEGLQEKLFGSDGLSGLFGEDFDLSDADVKTIADYLMGISDKTEAYYDAMDRVEKLLQDEYGVSMKDEDSSGMTKTIQGVTEDTADLLASYINAIRADVSMKREYLREITDEYMPHFSVVAEAQLRQLEAIAINTENNARYANDIKEMLSSNIIAGKGFKMA
jgi:hypothetical protein